MNRSRFLKELVENEFQKRWGEEINAPVISEYLAPEALENTLARFAGHLKSTIGFGAPEPEMASYSKAVEESVSVPSVKRMTRTIYESPLPQRMQHRPAIHRRPLPPRMPSSMIQTGSGFHPLRPYPYCAGPRRLRAVLSLRGGGCGGRGRGQLRGGCWSCGGAVPAPAPRKRTKNAAAYLAAVHIRCLALWFDIS